ncbi:hypothetical protein DPMN_154950 [Dreissena polymorpha]|uniref:Uncharacterized protein n=1 Tax=Dreissena polymorpha TaxID=45954 RepID=A0A9D4FSU9_DREPO|nr:hypothetical protein DPMN_154950 [Dreissena polymorpha]
MPEVISTIVLVLQRLLREISAPRTVTFVRAIKGKQKTLWPANVKVKMVASDQEVLKKCIEWCLVQWLWKPPNF